MDTTNDRSTEPNKDVQISKQVRILRHKRGLKRKNPVIGKSGPKTAIKKAAPELSEEENSARKLLMGFKSERKNHDLVYQRKKS